MERMWRKVSGRQSKKTATNVQSITSGFEDGHSMLNITATSNNATGRRLASSESSQKTISQIVLQNKNVSSEHRRRRHRKTRPRRIGGVNCVSGASDNMSSSGGFYTLKESPKLSFPDGHKYNNQAISQNAPCGTILMYPNVNQKIPISSTIPQEHVTLKMTTTTTSSDISLRQRAVAKLRMLNFNWDLHMTQCKPCGPRFSGSGNILTRRLCRNRRSEDNELYRSNSFKFERFERKECLDELSDSFQKQISICDDYSLPIDFVKKRPSSFDPCLAESFQSQPQFSVESHQTNIAISKDTEENQIIQSEQLQLLSTFKICQSGAGSVCSLTSSKARRAFHSLKEREKKTKRKSHTQTKIKNHEINPDKQLRQQNPTEINETPVELLNNYLNPNDSKQPKIVQNKKNKRKKCKKLLTFKNGVINKEKELEKKNKTRIKEKRVYYSSDSSVPKSSDDEDCNILNKKIELDSQDSLSEEILFPISSQAHNTPLKKVILSLDYNKINSSPYYYSDLLKSSTDKCIDKSYNNCQSTVFEVPLPSQESNDCNPKKKSPDSDKSDHINIIDKTIFSLENISKRYSFTEEGVHIIRCESSSSSSTSTSTSDESDCSECQKRRKWHAKALALVRKTCNVVPLTETTDDVRTNKETKEFNTSMSPRKLLGQSLCNCVTPAVKEDLDYFRPCSILYVKKQNDNETVEFSSNLQVMEVGVTHCGDDLDKEMSSKTRKIYETAFDCKVTKSDDDLDEVDRITNHSILHQQINKNNPSESLEANQVKKTTIKTRIEAKRMKNSKNQSIQEQTSISGGNSGSGSSNTLETNSVYIGTEHDKACALSSNLACISIDDDKAEMQKNGATPSSSQLILCGYTPSPPSTAPLPMKFPCKREKVLINSIKSAPNLPYSNSANPKLTDLALTVHPQSFLRKKQYESSLDKIEKSQTASVYVNQTTSAAQQGKKVFKKNHSRSQNRPHSFILEPGRVVELRRSHAGYQHPGKNSRSKTNFSSTESIVSLSSDGSLESLRSSTSEGNRSTTSSESHHSTSLSSHSSESGGPSIGFPLKASAMIHSKLHILSPISDKSSQEPSSELTEHNKTRNLTYEDSNQQKEQANVADIFAELQPTVQILIDPLKKKKILQNKVLNLTDEMPGSDSGISIISREDGKTIKNSQSFVPPNFKLQMLDKANDSGISDVGKKSISTGLPQDLRDLPFDMPKLRRRKALQQEGCTSGSATSVDLGDLPFDMPKLRRRLRANAFETTNMVEHSTESSGISQASSSHSVRDDKIKTKNDDTSMFRKNLTLNLNETRQPNKFGSLDLRGISNNKDGSGRQCSYTSAVDLIDVTLPLERQGWYHGAITRIEAESILRPLCEGSFLVRNCESTKQDYSLSLKGAKGFMHMRIQRNETGKYILGQFSRPFENVSEMIRHFCINRLPVRGAEHMCLIDPVIAPLL